MFFRRKNRQSKINAAEAQQSLTNDAPTVEGTAPELVEEASRSSSVVEETVAATVISAKGEPVATETMASADASLQRTSSALTGVDSIRLFPGFERDDFEVGFRPQGEAPCLVMRWKDGGDWFVMPNLFNRAVLAAMDERDSASDLNRLLRNYGYDVDSIDG